MGQIATLGGRLLTGLVDVTWTLKHGTDPMIGVFEMHPDDADALINLPLPSFDSGGGGTRTRTPGAGGTVDLIVKSDDRPTLTVKGLYVVKRMPGPDHYRGIVMVADRRWFWQRKHVVRRYNIRRKTGNRRLVEGELMPLENFEDDIAYIPFSLQDEKKKWTAKEVMKDILKILGEDDAQIGDLPTTASMSIENLEVDEPGDAALAVALSHLPEVAIYLDYDSKVRVMDKAAGGEVEQLRRAKIQSFSKKIAEGRIEGGGTILVQDLKRVRPKYVDVLFTRNLEVRHDYVEGDTRTIDGRYLINVGPIPDRYLNIDGKGLVVQGTWVEFYTPLYNAWGDGPHGLGILDNSLIRRDYPWGLLQLTYGEAGETLPDVDWQQRIGMIMHHFYRSYQMNKRWTDRCLEWKPLRVGLVDPENGTFQKAQVFTNYCVRPSIRGMLKDPDKAVYMYNIEGWNALLADARIAPATVVPEDQELGIFSVQFATHPLRWVEEYLPAMVQSVPTADVSNKLNRVDKLGGMAFKTPHKVAVVLTMVPGWPNNINQLHCVRLTFDDVRKESRTAASSPNGEGPPIQVRVPSQFPARYCWLDDQADLTQEAFGIGGKTTEDPLELSKKLDVLMVNGDEVDAIAKAVALAVYMPLRDRAVGEATDEIRADLLPEGTVTQVTHGLSERCVTHITLAPDLPPVNWMSYLPDNIRRTILRQVQ